MAYVRQNPEFPKFRMKKGIMPDFSGSNVADQEKPSGEMNGLNRVFQTANRPLNLSERVFKDGMMMSRASSMAMADGDYFIDYETRTITFADNQIPRPNSVIRVSYKFMRVV